MGDARDILGLDSNQQGKQVNHSIQIFFRT